MELLLTWFSVHYVGLSALAGMVIMGYQHRLMWKDYRKRHRINGDSNGV